MGREMGTIKTEEVFNWKKECFETIKYDTTEVLQTLPKYHVAYLTPREKGICLAPRPPYVKPLELPRGAPRRKRGWKGWFPLESSG